MTKITKQLSISENTTISLNFKNADVSVGVSPDKQVHITYYNTAWYEYEIEQSDRELVLKQRLLLWFCFSFSKIARSVTVLIPKQFSGDLNVSCTSGSKTLDNIFANNIHISSLSGRTNVTQVSSQKDITIKSTSGSINLCDVKSTDGELVVKNTSGNTSLDKVSANNIQLNSFSGKITLEQIICTDITIKGTSGSIGFSEMNAQNISIALFSGSVCGNIIGKQSDFSVTSHVMSGSNNLPSDWAGSGNKTLKVSTTSGSIKVLFTE